MELFRSSLVTLTAGTFAGVSQVATQTVEKVDLRTALAALITAASVAAADAIIRRYFPRRSLSARPRRRRKPRRNSAPVQPTK